MTLDPHLLASAPAPAGSAAPPVPRSAAMAATSRPLQHGGLYWATLWHMHTIPTPLLSTSSPLLTFAHIWGSLRLSQEALGKTLQGLGPGSPAQQYWTVFFSRLPGIRCPYCCAKITFKRTVRHKTAAHRRCAGISASVGVGSRPDASQYELPGALAGPWYTLSRHPVKLSGDGAVLERCER